jgi:integrase
MKCMFTDRFLKSIRNRPDLWNDEHQDVGLPGFGLRISPLGKITFQVIARMPGHKNPTRAKVGSYPRMLLAAARDAGRAALNDIANDIHPKQKKARQRAREVQEKANSFEAICERFIQNHVSKLRRWRQDEAIIRQYLIPRFGGQQISDITRRDIIGLVEEIAESGRLSLARKVHAHCSSLFSWALARDIIDASPSAGVRISKLIGSIEPRQRVLTDSEIRGVWNAAGHLGYPFASLTKLLLMTGQRLRECAEAQWNEFDLDRGLWVIPGSRMKNGVSHEVPLPRMAVELLQSLPRWEGRFVFSTDGGQRPVRGFSKVKQRLDAASGVSNWVFHDLRRSVRTQLGGLPVPSDVCERCIAHAPPGLHKVYDLHSYRQEKARAFELWAERLAEIIDPDRNSNVVRLKA